jgi:glycosyltransferase involved in cell wall biosynthesis
MIARSTTERVRLVLATLEERGRGDRDDDWKELARVLSAGGDEAVWITLAVMDSRLPGVEQVRSARRQIRTEGSSAFLGRWSRPRLTGRRRLPVEVLTDAVVLDVHHTAHTTLGTGIQRVVRQILQHWQAPSTLVGWTPTMTALRGLSPQECENATWGGQQVVRPRDLRVVVPWRSRYVLLELAVEDSRTSRLAALAEFSGNSTFVIGFDCVPLTSGETTGAGMGQAFARNLVAVSRFDRVIPISAAAGIEYAGWRRMLAGTGLAGPQIDPLELPGELPTAGKQYEAAAVGLRVGDLPLLLCVGSHEPRKNHMAVLYAAEALWRDGHQFSLAFIGGNSWNSENFETEVARLQAHGHPVRTATGVPDDVLIGAYRAASAVVFPSLNEGFGLPVSEALAAGTPVVTSDYGSMREIGEHRGALLVDPRDDDSVREGIRTVLFDPATRARLTSEIAALSFRSWADYTRDLQALVLGEG